MQKIKQALKTLHIVGIVTMQEISFDRIQVLVGGRYFGIWDLSRNTFVD